MAGTQRTRAATGSLGVAHGVLCVALALVFASSSRSDQSPAAAGPALSPAAGPGEVFSPGALGPLPPSYSLRRWGTADGLPAHTINEVRQGPDGYLWLATTAGLVRFDGDRFTVFDHKNSGLVNPRLTKCLFTDRGGIRVMDENRVWMESRTTDAPRFFTPPVPWNEHGDALTDKQGRIWTVCDDGEGAAPCRLEDDGSRTLVPQRAKRGTSIVSDGRGDLWLRLASGEPARLEGDVFRPHGDPQSNVGMVTASSRREILTARTKGRRTELLGADSRVVATYEERPGWTPELLDRFGNLWWHRPDEIEVTRADGESAFWNHRFTPGTALTAITEDAEGDIWIGTATEGLYRITPAPFVVYGEEAGIADTSVADICPTADGFLIRTWRGINYLLRGGRAELVRGYPDPRVIFRDGSGTTWTLGSTRVTSTGQEHDFVGRSPSGELRIATLVPGLGFPCLFSSDRPDVLWVHDEWRVYRITDLESARPTVTMVVGGPESTIRPIRDTRQVLVDRAGTLWIASGNGVHTDRNGTRTTYTMKDGLPTNLVRAIYEDRVGTLWFGTYGGGLVRMKDGRFQSLNATRGLAEDVVNTILEDRFGNFWMAGNRGIFRTPRKDVEAVLDGRVSRVTTILYGPQAGLVNPESSGGAGVVDASGRFWFPTLAGAAVVDPATALALEDTPIRVRVGTVSNTPHQASQEEGGFLVPAGSQRLTIGFTAIALRDSENVQLQYRLDGYDADWVASGTDRIATYTHVPPGQYRFHVRAFAPPGRWVESEAPVTLHFLPAFHQTSLFKTLVVMAAIGFTLALFQARTRFLKRRARRLERTVAERTVELAREKEIVARQVEQLQELERAKSRFFANVSHEFRTPLTLIQGPLEDLQDGLHGPLRDDAREQIDVATRSSHRLLHLVDQLLDIARAESGRLSLRARRGDYRLFLRRIVGSLEPLAERKGVALGMECPETALPLWFDPEHLEKVLQNVIGNALKFTPAGGHVTVRVRAEGGFEESGALVTEVEDDGPGISADDLPRIFDRFHRGVGPSRTPPGAGIGLALAKELVVLHRGSLSVESREGEGSAFTIRLPRGRTHLADAELVPEDEADLLRVIGDPVPDPGDGTRTIGADVVQASTPGRLLEELHLEPARPAGSIEPVLPAGLDPATDVTTILVADDNAEVRGYVRAHLARHYRVLEAADGREALEVARRALPDLVVSDVMMPRMDGFDLCRALKSDPETDYIPVVLLTARASSDSRIEGLQEGADDYLTKPFNVRELEVRVDNLIASRRRLKERFAAAAGAEKSAVDDGGAAGSPSRQADHTLRAHTISITPGIVGVASADAGFLDQVRTAIEARLGDEDFDSDALARAVGAGRTTLYRRLKELLRQSPMGLIRRMRLEHAALLLERGDGAIGEIAYAVGFRSVAHFSASFKEQYGATPSAYRKSPRDPRGDA